MVSWTALTARVLACQCVHLHTVKLGTDGPRFECLPTGRSGWRRRGRCLTAQARDEKQKHDSDTIHLPFLSLSSRHWRPPGPPAPNSDLWPEPGQNANLSERAASELCYGGLLRAHRKGPESACWHRYARALNPIFGVLRLRRVGPRPSLTLYAAVIVACGIWLLATSNNVHGPGYGLMEINFGLLLFAASLGWPQVRTRSFGVVSSPSSLCCLPIRFSPTLS